ncbi:ATP synthase protein I [Melghiribacillus thermohalophilus]|uniref:ATP synthase protein I n=1 Tax=Melghiribacillus thermohalophilus TaxID=1324956 RepID=A0A4R3NGI3_9BACI|nr:ATP synthase protein I [Melghiribacillus thermohalophilus]
MVQQYQMMVNWQRKYMLYLLAVMFFCWALFPDYRQVLSGLILGSSFSFFNLWLLQRKINLIGYAAEKQQTVRAMGTFSRMAAAILAVMIALRFPQYFHLLFVIIGLTTSYVVIVFSYLLHLTQHGSRK